TCEVGAQHAAPLQRPHCPLTALRSRPLPGPPEAWRRELDQVAVGIPEIQARAAPRPGDARLDRHRVPLEVRLPGGELLRRNGKGDVEPPRSVVSRDRAER